jgi:hypothetical protein
MPVSQGGTQHEMDNGNDDTPLQVDVEGLEEIELRIIAEKVWAMLARDALTATELRGGRNGRDY